MMILTSRHGARNSETLHVSTGCVKWYTDGAEVTAHGVKNEVILLYYYLYLHASVILMFGLPTINIHIDYTAENLSDTVEKIVLQSCVLPVFVTGSSVADFRLCNILEFPAYDLPMGVRSGDLGGGSVDQCVPITFAKRFPGTLVH
jgi:hypothetical protein